jgi:hypothetical protein
MATRLLDWTESLFVAAFFAVANAARSGEAWHHLCSLANYRGECDRRKQPLLDASSSVVSTAAHYF